MLGISSSSMQFARRPGFTNTNQQSGGGSSQAQQTSKDPKSSHQSKDDIIAGAVGIGLTLLSSKRKRTAARRVERRGKLTAAEIMRQANEVVDASRDASNRQRGASVASVAAAGFDSGTGAAAIQQDLRDAILEEERIMTGAKRQAYEVKRNARKRSKLLKRASIVEPLEAVGSFAGGFFGLGKSGGAIGRSIGEAVG